MTALLEKILNQAAQWSDSNQDILAERLMQTLAHFEREKQQSDTNSHPQFGNADAILDAYGVTRSW